MVTPPLRCVVDVSSGALAGGTGRYEKRLSDLAGIYRDEAAFRAKLAGEGDRVVYAVEDLRPSTQPGDLIFGVTRMARRQGRRGVFRDARPHPRPRQPAGDLLRREWTRADAARIAGRREPHRRYRAEGGLLCAALLDSPLGQRRRRGSGRNLRLSRRFPGRTTTSSPAPAACGSGSSTTARAAGARSPTGAGARAAWRRSRASWRRRPER